VRAKAWANGRIDRSMPMPLYFQIAEQLRHRVRATRMRPGDLLTTDEQIQEQFSVSRATARKAIDELVDDGVVERVTGKGTFVTAPRIQVPLPSMLSFTEELDRRGMNPTTRVVSAIWTSASPHAAQALEIAPGARVMRLERIRYADQQPILHTVDILPEGLGIGPEEDFSGSLYKLMEARGIQLAECQNLIRAGVTDGRLGKLLQVKKGFPVLVLHRTSIDREKRAVLYEDATCRGDLYSYVVRLAREARPLGK